MSTKEEKENEKEKEAEFEKQSKRDSYIGKKEEGEEK